MDGGARPVLLEPNGRLPLRAGQVLAVLALAYALFAAGRIALDPAAWQWDFQVYHLARQAHALGMDPYDLASLRAVTRAEVNLPFVYQPGILALLAPLTQVDESTAKRLWLLGKLLASAGLLLAWRRSWIGPREFPWFAAFALFAFNATWMTDWSTGNAALFEQAALWGAFACLAAGRPLAFGVVVGAVAGLKLAPLLFLALPFALGRREGLRGLLGGGLAFGAALGIPALLQPDLFARWIEAVRGLEENRGLFNPSAWALAQDAADLAGLGRGAAAGLYALVVAGAVAGFVAAARRVAGWKPEDRRRAVVLLGILAFAVASPRMKDYGWIFVLPAAFAALARAPGPAWAWALASAVVSTSHLYLPELRPFTAHLFWNYHPWIVAAIAYGLALASILREPAPKDPPS